MQPRATSQIQISTYRGMLVAAYLAAQVIGCGQGDASFMPDSAGDLDAGSSGIPGSSDFPCAFGGEFYETGELFSCGTCTLCECLADGSFLSYELNCEACTPGEEFLAEDRCNTCTCPETGLRSDADCTDKSCASLCFSDNDCDATSYCVFGSGLCGLEEFTLGTEDGRCRPAELLCDEAADTPALCGCDGTLRTSCRHQQAGSDVAFLGGCDSPTGGFICGTSEVLCQASDFCIHRPNRSPSFECLAIPESCTQGDCDCPTITADRESLCWAEFGSTVIVLP